MLETGIFFPLHISEGSSVDEWSNAKSLKKLKENPHNLVVLTPLKINEGGMKKFLQEICGKNVQLH